MDKYKVLPFQGRSNKFALYKIGNTIATKIYTNEVSLKTGLIYLMFHKPCVIDIYDKNGLVMRVLESK